MLLVDPAGALADFRFEGFDGVPKAGAEIRTSGASSLWPIGQIGDRLARIGVARGEQESLGETFAHFLGINPRDLRVQLQRRQPASTRNSYPIFSTY
jgi:hypothetical protein